MPYTFAFTGDFERGELGLLWSLSSLVLVLLLLPPGANIAILNYARTVTRQQEFAARHALGGSRARIVWQLFIEALVLTAAAAGVALLVLRVVSVVAAGRLQNIPGGPPFWMTFGVPYRTLLFVAGLALAGAAVSGLVPALQATGRLARLGAGALAGRTSVRLGATWTTLVIAQVAFSVGVLPLAAELAWGTLRTGVVGPGFAAEEFATARVALEEGRFGLDAPDVNAAPRQMASEPEGARRQRAELFDDRQRELARRLLADPGILGVATALRPPGEEPWVFVDIEGRDRRPSSTSSTAVRRDFSPGSTRSIPRSSISIRCLASPVADSRRATLPRRPMRSSSTVTSPRPSPPAATRSDAVSGTSARRTASGGTARQRTVGTRSLVSSEICP